MFAEPYELYVRPTVPSFITLIMFVNAEVALVKATPDSLGKISFLTYLIASIVSANCSLSTISVPTFPDL